MICNSCKDNNINEALRYACANGHLECAEWCVKHGANDFNNALRYACANGHLECAEWCVKHGANNFNWALVNACENGHLECAELCVKHGANNFNRALRYACRKENLECAEWRVKHGAKKCTSWNCTTKHVFPNILAIKKFQRLWRFNKIRGFLDVPEDVIRSSIRKYVV